jgi:hypothetical protein
VIALAGAILFPAYVGLHAADFRPNDSWTSAQTQAALAQLGWPATIPAFVDLARNLLLFAVGFPVGLLLLWRRHTNWFMLYLAFVFISFSLGDALLKPLIAILPGFSLVNHFMGTAAWQFFFIMMYFFPSGQPAPGWSRWLALIWLGLIVGQASGNAFFLNGSGLYFVLPISAILSQIYRYFKRSNPLQRQQTKWIFTAVILMLAFIALVGPWAFNAPTGPDYRGNLVIALANLFMFSVLFAIFPLAVAVAIFRYRLWDIDLVIRRTLSYGVLTAILALIYLGGVTLFQQILTALTGQNSAAAVVLTTLLIAALFTPLRRRVQTTIDQRFYRRKYDAIRAMEEFSAVARSEVELEVIGSRLATAVQESLEPESVSLWLKKQEGNR